jgi:hypothetical protein
MSLTRPRALVIEGWPAAAIACVHGRIAEGLLTLVTIYWGSFILITPPSMTSPSYALLLSWMPETGWGAAMLCAGVTHLIALHVNGRRRAITTIIRSIISAATASVWTGVWLGFAIPNPYGTASATYLLLVIPSWCACYLAMRDAMRMRYGLEDRRAWRG